MEGEKMKGLGRYDWIETRAEGAGLGWTRAGWPRFYNLRLFFDVYAEHLRLLGFFFLNHVHVR